MFRKAIGTPIYPLTQEYINLLYRPFNEPDLTLTMLGIVCFKNKIEDYRGIQGAVRSLASFEDFQNISSKDGSAKNDIYFDYNVLRSFRKTDTELTNFVVPEEWQSVTAVENMISSKFSAAQIAIWKNTKANQVIVLTNSGGMDVYHLVLSFLPLYYPQIYTKRLTKQDPEAIVLSSLSKTSSDMFERSLSDLLRPYAAEFYRLQITKLLENSHERRIYEARSTVDRARAVRDNAMSRYEDAIRAYRGAVANCEGIIATEQKAEWEDDVVDYLCSNEKIRNATINGDELTFSVATTLQQFSTDAWDCFARNGNIYNGPYAGYNPAGVFADRSNRKLLFDAIFSDDAKFEVKMCGNYSINVYSQGFSTSSSYSYEAIDPIYADYIPNPHLKNFECLGDYHYRVVEALRREDLITALELCVYSAGSVNLDETEQNFKPLLKWILMSQKKILRRYDGVDMTPSEALLWLIESKEHKDETNANE